ncbi:hypothetical protein TWF694_005984 [Orbilia ellipsospora]|uniref:DUF7704 domain-containing protein n=1 Tax=Orbilia ellipsospora TaxID=2528407 RepID=A0AAV9WQZ8_9PEZI
MGGQFGLVYRIFFFYIEPIIILSGAYLTQFAPDIYFSKVLPGNSDPILPSTQHILTSLASSYVFLTIIEGILLRVTNDKRVWQVAILGMVLNDIVHLYGVYIARMEIGLGIRWNLSRREDWEIFVPSYLSLFLRIAFLTGWDGWVEDDKREREKHSRSYTQKTGFALHSATTKAGRRCSC